MEEKLAKKIMNEFNEVYLNLDEDEHVMSYCFHLIVKIVEKYKAENKNLFVVQNISYINDYDLCGIGFVTDGDLGGIFFQSDDNALINMHWISKEKTSDFLKTYSPYFCTSYPEFPDK